MDRLSMITLGIATARARSIAADVVDEALADFPNGITFKGSVDYASGLPDDAEVGDEYLVLYAGSSGTEYLGQKLVWDGNAWRALGTELKLYRDSDGDLCEED